MGVAAIWTNSHGVAAQVSGRNVFALTKDLLFLFPPSFIILSISRLHKKLLDTAAESKPARLVTKPYVNGVVPFHSRSLKLVERFSDMYKNDRVQILNSLKGMPDNSTAGRFVFLIVEVRQNRQKFVTGRSRKWDCPSFASLDQTLYSRVPVSN